MSARSIWPATGGRHVRLRCELRLDGPCRNGRLRCAASGPFQLYLDGTRIGGAPGGAAGEATLWHPLALRGAWESGAHELIAVVDGGDTVHSRWFLCEGELDPAAGDRAQVVESGLHWQGATVPAPAAGGAVDESHSALEVPGTSAWPWEGVDTVPGTAPEAEAPAVVESLVLARTFAAVAEIAADDPLSFAPNEALPRRCKFVHRDGLLAGPTPAASLRTTGDRGLLVVLDLGRVVTGVPHLRLREGRGGVIDLATAVTWGRIDRRLRYVCGSGRQDWVALRPVRCRYLVVRLTQFTEEALLERIALLERAVEAAPEGTELEVEPSVDAAWEIGARALRGVRLDTYHVTPPPAPCDWLGVLACLLNDAARTGHTETARATLEARAPAADADPSVLAGSAAFALCLDAYHMWSGDDRVSARLLPAAVACSTVHPPATAGSRDLALQAAAAAAAARLCERLARRYDTGPCELAAEAAVHRLEAHWDETGGLYRDGADADSGCSQGVNALILSTGLAPAARTARMATALRAEGVAPVADLHEAFLLADGLWRVGQGARAYEVVRNRWLRLVERDGPTWRDKRPAEADRVAPGPDYLLLHWLLGVSPLQPGFARTQVRPALGLVRWARGRLRTPRGSLAVTWRTRAVEGEPLRTTLEVETEGDGITELVLERGGRKHPTVSVNGQVVWRNEKIYPNPSVHEIGADPETITLVVARAGHWEVVLD